MSDASVTADEAKAAGNAAFKAKDYEEAVKQFTLAIDADPTNHVLYSNRSGAHAAKAAFTDALMDANKCIDLNKDWAKGHSRRGAAYFGLRNWPQSQTAYEKALELDPSSQVVKDELEKVKARRQGSGGAAARAAQAVAASAVGAPVTTGAAPMLSVSALVFGLLYMVPVLGPARALGFYKASVGNILMLFAINLWNAFPKKLATLSDPKFKATQEAQAFMLCIFMALSPPMPFALAPFLAVAFLNVCATAKGRLPGALSFVATKLDYFTTSEGSMQARKAIAFPPPSPLPPNAHACPRRPQWAAVGRSGPQWAAAPPRRRRTACNAVPRSVSCHPVALAVPNPPAPPPSRPFPLPRKPHPTPPPAVLWRRCTHSAPSRRWSSPSCRRCSSSCRGCPPRCSASSTSSTSCAAIAPTTSPYRPSPSSPSAPMASSATASFQRRCRRSIARGRASSVSSPRGLCAEAPRAEQPCCSQRSSGVACKREGEAPAACRAAVVEQLSPSLRANDCTSTPRGGLLVARAAK